MSADDLSIYSTMLFWLGSVNRLDSSVATQSELLVQAQRTNHAARTRSCHPAICISLLACFSKDVALLCLRCTFANFPLASLLPAVRKHSVCMRRRRHGTVNTTPCACLAWSTRRLSSQLYWQGASSHAFCHSSDKKGFCGKCTPRCKSVS